MNEIISLFGQPFNPSHDRRVPARASSAKRVGTAFLLLFGTLALVALVSWISYGSGPLQVWAGVVPRGNIALLLH